jgi:amino acid transporter
MASKISFFSALIISINIMLGSGIFINTVILAKTAGSLGSLTYLVGALLIFPLIFVIAQLLKYQKGGTFYDFGALIHPFIGFISSWGYFVSKIASAALGVHIFVTLLQLIFPFFITYHALLLDSIIIILFGFLNILNIRIGSIIQRGFLSLKLLPILLVIISALFLFSSAPYIQTPLLWQGIPESLPFVIFAFSGFEAVCSLSQSIENHQKNGPRAIFLAFAIVLSILLLYQTSFFGILGTQLSTLGNFKEAFPLLIAKIFISPTALSSLMLSLTLLGIACSSLGASYGIFYSNAWNLFTLAQNKHVPAFLQTTNLYAIPYFCIFFEIIGALGYLWITQGNQIPLQQISACGSTFAYTLSVGAFFYQAFLRKRQRCIAVLGLTSCTILIASLYHNSLKFGFFAYTFFGLIIIIGSLFFIAYKKLSQFKSYQSQKA